MGNFETIVNVYHYPVGSIPVIGLSYGDYIDLRTRQTVFDDLTAGDRSDAPSPQMGLQKRRRENSRRKYFSLLGVKSQLGRVLQPSDTLPGAPFATVISNGVWQRMFGELGHYRTDAQNQRQKLRNCWSSAARLHGYWRWRDGSKFIMDSNGRGSITSRHSGHGVLDRNDRSARWLLVKGRLKKGHTLDEAAAEVKGIAGQLDLAYPIGRENDPAIARHLGLYHTKRPWSIRKASDVRIDESVDRLVGPMVWSIMAAVVLVLLVACTNIANLMLARASGRRHEQAVRLALGASRWNLVRGLLAECTILALAGGVSGIAVARGLFYLLGQRFEHYKWTGSAFRPATGFSCHCRFWHGYPSCSDCSRLGARIAVHSGRFEVGLATDGFHGAGPRWRGRRSLIAAQVAVSVVMLSITALCISQIRDLSRQNSGMELEHLALAQVDFITQGYEETRVRQIVGAVLQHMSSIPDVVSVAASSGLPAGMTTPGCAVGAPGQRLSFGAEFVAATPGVFSTLGIPVERGRAIE